MDFFAGTSSFITDNNGIVDDSRGSLMLDGVDDSRGSQMLDGVRGVVAHHSDLSRQRIRVLVRHIDQVD